MALDQELLATQFRVLTVAVMAPRLIEHKALAVESAYVITPVPEPPAVVRVTDVPTGLVNAEFEIERVACAPMKLKLTGADTACAKEISAAFVAVTVQIVAAVAPKVALVSVQLAPVTAKLTAPDPEPPVVVRVTAFPAVLVSVELEIERVVCGLLKVKTMAVEVILANKPWAALVATTEHWVGWLAVTVVPTNEHEEFGVESA